MLSLRNLCVATFAPAFVVFSQSAIAKPLESLKSKEMAWFFNKPGTALDTVLKDVEDCRNISARAQDKAVDIAPEAGNGLLALAWTGLLSGGRTNLDVAHCMASRDYGRYEIYSENQKDFSKRLEKMSRTELSGYFTADTPPLGELADYDANGLYVLKENALRTSGTLEKVKPNQALPSLLKFGGPLILNKKLPPKPMSKPSALDANKATLVARLNFSGKAGRFDRPDLLFLKRDPKTGHFVLTEDQKPIVFRIANHKPDKLVEGFQIFQVEPGQYALWQVNGRKQAQVTYTCLSTIALDVAAGDAIYLGDWTLNPDGKYSATTDGNAEAGSALKIIDGETVPLKSAEFKNGADTPCTSVVGGGTQLYYFELP